MDAECFCLAWYIRFASFEAVASSVYGCTGRDKAFSMIIFAFAPTFQVNVAEATALLTDLAPKFFSLGHLFQMVALNNSFWFYVKPNTHLLKRSGWESLVYKEIMCCKKLGGSFFFFDFHGHMLRFCFVDQHNIYSIILYKIYVVLRHHHYRHCDVNWP